ncbi:CAP domain-containing protein [Spirosoma sp. BT702]|uniref:CAP domain-containing protein n=1 Tax=Spirosoma profusum TaxID=2771354 RepID=A0A926Y0K2_9BACT|nr:CAP domain-containing protein [Spirosoma profusum]MBD2704257.1 CAP domain-containing protein [Spirosoma profusum]
MKPINLVGLAVLLCATAACQSDKEMNTNPEPIMSSIYQEDDKGSLDFTPNLAGARAAAATSAQQTEILNRINAIRAKPCTCGGRSYPAVPALTLNNQLNTAADKHAVDMASKNYFSHMGRDGSDPGTRIKREGYAWSTYAENIAAGYTASAQVVDGWRASVGHCQNIMNPNLKHLGVGYGYSSSSTYKYYWVALFAKPK